LTLSAVKSQIFAAWNRFFFEPIPAYSLGLFRIAYAAMLLVVLALLLPDVPVWYGEEGVLPAAYVGSMLDPPRFSLLTWFPQSELAVYAVFGCAFVAAGALLVGFWTRWASIAVWACVVTLHHRNVYLLNSGDHLLRNLSFLMMFAPACAALSLDRWRRIRRGVESAGVPLIVPWAQRLLQLQVCILYFDSVLWKLAGIHWLDGTAAYYVIQLDEFKRFPVPAFCATLWFSRIATWFALATEVAMATLVWVRPWRRYVLCAGIALHLGLEYSMNIPLFQWVVLASYCLFLDNLSWNRLRPAAKTAGLESAELLNRARSICRARAKRAAIDRRGLLRTDHLAAVSRAETGESLGIHRVVQEPHAAVDKEERRAAVVVAPPALDRVEVGARALLHPPSDGHERLEGRAEDPPTEFSLCAGLKIDAALSDE
jgi:hypothetical protein